MAPRCQEDAQVGRQGQEGKALGRERARLAVSNFCRFSDLSASAMTSPAPIRGDMERCLDVHLWQVENRRRFVDPL